jgi:aryl-alcohol dehydrogenase-like predicted oxidoreductase
MHNLKRDSILREVSGSLERLGVEERGSGFRR